MEFLNCSSHCQNNLQCCSLNLYNYWWFIVICTFQAVVRDNQYHLQEVLIKMLPWKKVDRTFPRSGQHLTKPDFKILLTDGQSGCSTLVRLNVFFLFLLTILISSVNLLLVFSSSFFNLVVWVFLLICRRFFVMFWILVPSYLFCLRVHVLKSAKVHCFSLFILCRATFTEQN